MHSHVLKIAARHLLLPFLVISIIILFRGHNQPGGGFIGGLIAAAAFTLYLIANGVDQARHLLTIDPKLIIAIGLALALGSGILSLFFQKDFMTSLWIEFHVPGLGHLHLGTPMFFDAGVYFVVIGVILTIVFTLSEES